MPFKKIEDEAILLDLESGAYFEVNEIGLFLWNQLAKAKTENDLAKKLQKEYGISLRTAMNDAKKFLGQLKKLGLVKVIEK